MKFATLIKLPEFTLAQTQDLATRFELDEGVSIVPAYKVRIICDRHSSPYRPDWPAEFSHPSYFQFTSSPSGNGTLRSCTILNKWVSAARSAAETHIYRSRAPRANGKCERCKI